MCRRSNCGSVMTRRSARVVEVRPPTVWTACFAPRARHATPHAVLTAATAGDAVAAAVVRRVMQAAALALDDDGRVEGAEVRGRRRGSGFSKVMASLRRLPIAENASASK